MTRGIGVRIILSVMMLALTLSACRDEVPPVEEGQDAAQRQAGIFVDVGLYISNTMASTYYDRLDLNKEDVESRFLLKTLADGVLEGFSLFEYRTHESARDLLISSRVSLDLSETQRIYPLDIEGIRGKSDASLSILNGPVLMKLDAFEILSGRIYKASPDGLWAEIVKSAGRETFAGAVRSCAFHEALVREGYEIRIASGARTLLEGLNGDRSLILGSIRLAGRMENEESTRLLSAILLNESANEDFRIEAARALRARAGASEALTTVIRDGKCPCLQEAMLSLALSRVPGALDTLAPVLKQNGDETSRRYALLAMGLLGDAGALPLLEAAETKAPRLKGMAALSRDMIATGSPLSSIMQALEGRDSEARMAGLQALSVLEEPGFIAPVIQTLRASGRDDERMAANKVLEGITGVRLPKGSYEEWSGWWAENGSYYGKGCGTLR